MTTPASTGRLGPLSATALVISHTVGVGIFLTPAELIGAIRSPGWTLGLWGLCGAIVLAGALTFGELASRYPQSGGLYVYLREAWGPRVAFLYGWQSLLIMDPGVTAALAAGASQYIVLLWPSAAGFERWVGVVAIWTIAGLNMAGLTFGARTFGVLTVVKLCTLSGIVILALTMGHGSWSHFATVPGARAGAPLAEAIAVGLVGVFFSFGGFWETSRLAGEVRDARRTLPRALALGVIAVTVIYVMTTVAFIYLVPPAEATSATAFARRAGEAMLGPAGPGVLAAAVLISVIGSAMAMIMVAPRLYEAMGRDGLFPPGVAVRSPTTGAPVRATLVLASLATAFVLLGTFEQIVSFSICTALGFIALAAGAAFVVRRRGVAPDAFRAPGYPFTPALFILLVLMVVAMIAINRPAQALAGLVLMLLGLPAHGLFVRSRRASNGAVP